MANDLFERREVTICLARKTQQVQLPSLFPRSVRYLQLKLILCIWTTCRSERWNNIFHKNMNNRKIRREKERIYIEELIF